MIWRSSRRNRRTQRDPWDLDIPLFFWHEGAPWTIRDSFQSACIMGATGSGKSSGSLRLLSRNFLKAGYGALFCCVKREDGETYEQYVREAGRESDLIAFSPSNPLRTNFIAAEREQCPDAIGLADTLTSLLTTVASLGDRSGQARGGGSENAEYFRQASERLCRYAMLVLIQSGRELSAPNLYRLILSAPKSRDEPCNPEWQQASFFFGCLRAAEQSPKTASEQADFELATLFFMEEWCDLNTKTRTTVESTLTSATDALSRGAARDALSAPASTLNFSPSMLEEGKIVILDYPVLVHRDVAKLIQVVVKHMVQRSLSRRDVRASPRPVCIICDECQHLMTEHDALFVTTARSSRTSVVYATQSVATLLEAFGGQSTEPQMQSFLGNMQLQLHHQQTDTRTISYLQELTGKSLQHFVSSNTTRGQDWLGPLMGESSGGSAGISESYEFDLQSSDLNSLAKGGPPHFYTEAIVYQGGRPFADGKTWSLVRIPQQGAPKRRKRRRRTRWSH